MASYIQWGPTGCTFKTSRNESYRDKREYSYSPLDSSCQLFFVQECNLRMGGAISKCALPTDYQGTPRLANQYFGSNTWDDIVVSSFQPTQVTLIPYLARYEFKNR